MGARHERYDVNRQATADLQLHPQAHRGEGLPPAIRDICDAFSISSPNGVMCHLKALEKKGHISRVTKHKNKQRAQARGITIPGVSAGGFSLRLKGVVAAARHEPRKSTIASNFATCSATTTSSWSK